MHFVCLQGGDTEGETPGPSKWEGKNQIQFSCHQYVGEFEHRKCRQAYSEKKEIIWTEKNRLLIEERLKNVYICFSLTQYF